MNPEKDSAPVPPVEIPVDAVAQETLASVIASFIEREGTDYGAVEASQERKVSDIRQQLERGDIKLIFDANTESVTFVTKLQWLKLTKGL